MADNLQDESSKPNLVPAQPTAVGSLLTAPAAGGRKVVQLTWPQMQELVSRIAEQDQP